MSFNVLPIELIESIFTHVEHSDLLRLVTVNKEWNAVVTPLIWQNVTITICPQVNDAFLAAIKGRTIDITKFIHTKRLFIDFKLKSLGYHISSAEEIDEW